MESESDDSEVDHQRLAKDSLLEPPGRRVRDYVHRSSTRTYFVTDIAEGVTVFDADSVVVVRSPVLGSIDSTEMEVEF